MILEAESEIFDDYPIFDESYRSALNVKILRHYFFREINVVPYQKWRFFLNNSMNEIMPYYNQLYESTLLDYDVFYNLNVTETLDRALSGEQDHKNTREEIENRERQESANKNLTDSITSSQNQSANTNTVGKEVFEDTPFNKLGDSDYATTITGTTGNETSEVDTTGNSMQNQNTEDIKQAEDLISLNSTSDNLTKTKNTEDYVKKLVGKDSKIPSSTLLMEFRKTFLNIDMDIIKALNENFSGYFN